MRLVNLENLKSAVNGALRVFEQNNRLVLRRFTESQERLFAQTLNYVNKPLKAKASSSMSLDFVSNTNTFELNVSTFVASTRTPCFFDVYCDNEPVAHCGYNQMQDGFVKVKATFKQGENVLKYTSQTFLMRK